MTLAQLTTSYATGNMTFWDFQAAMHLAEDAHADAPIPWDADFASPNSRRMSLALARKLGLEA